MPTKQSGRQDRRSDPRAGGRAPSPSSPEEFGRYLKEMARRVKLVRDNGIKGD
jgi:hypothetical protein